jgi:hypothetical protein
MADRTSAELFCNIFEILAEDPSEDHKALALKVFNLTRGYDFCEYQMGADKYLLKLDLCRPAPTQVPGDMWYGPPGSDHRFGEPR